MTLLYWEWHFEMTFEKHLHPISRAASQRLGILRKSWWVFHDRSLLGRCIRGIVLAFLEYCSAVWCSAANTHIELLDHAASVAQFLTGVCLSVTLHIVDIWQHCVCCIRSGLNGGLYVPVRVTWGALVAHHYTYASPSCKTLQYCRTFIPLSVSLRNDLADSMFDGVGLAGFKSRAILFYWPKLLYPYYSVLLFFRLSSFCQ